MAVRKFFALVIVLLSTLVMYNRAFSLERSIEEKGKVAYFPY